MWQKICLVKYLFWADRYTLYNNVKRKYSCSELSSGIYCRIKLLSTDVSEVLTASIIENIHIKVWSIFSLLKSAQAPEYLDCLVIYNILLCRTPILQLNAISNSPTTVRHYLVLTSCRIQTFPFVTSRACIKSVCFQSRPTQDFSYPHFVTVETFLDTYCCVRNIVILST
jgi:hypothetical protein